MVGRVWIAVIDRDGLGEQGSVGRDKPLTKHTLSCVANAEIRRALLGANQALGTNAP